jgi:hypothetical protein
MKTPSNSIIAIVCLVGAIALMAYLFAESRNDPSLRIAALVAGTGLVASLSSIASTILTGKDVTKPDPADLPPGSISAHSESIQVPPIAPEVK